VHVGKLVEGRTGSERAPVVVGHDERQLRRGPDGDGNKNTATTLVRQLKGEVEELKEATVELRASWRRY